MQPFKYNPNYNTGQFRHRITFLKPVTLTDEIGQEITEWLILKRVWAMIKTVKGQEFFSVASVQAERTYRFIIRHTKGIDETMKIEYDGRLFDIQSVLNDDEERKTLTIIATERAGGEG
ncbi:phage head closure protein [Anoxybacteroides rupiense]|uniref:phage head closure protein n=1 Tax=Anoxybacteroides rupiense TaxID=311460 RepID=UPI00366DAA7A